MTKQDEIDKSPFTPEENELILALHEKLGSKWAEMSKLMPGRPDNAIKNHFNTSMQRQRRRLSLQDPSELQLKFSEGSGPSTSVTSPLPSPTTTTSTARGHRFDPYERRHSMPCLGMPDKMQSQQSATDGQLDGTPLPSRSVLTPPKTPDARLRLQFSPGMSRSSSLGSACRPSSGQNRPSVLVNPSTYKASNPYFASSTGTMGSSRPSSSPLSPNFPGRLARASSAISLSTHSGRQSPYSSYSGEQGYGYHQQEQQLHHSLPRPNLTRHESLRQHHPGYSRHSYHEHHRSLDASPYSALAELANLAEQHRDMRGTTANVVSKKESMDEDNCEVEGDDDMESAVAATMVAKPASASPARRFSTLLTNLKEEEHPDEHGHGSPTRARHSYHIDQYSELSNNLHSRPGLNGRSSSSPTPSPKAPRSSFYHPAERDSMEYSTSEYGRSDRDHDVVVDRQANAAYLEMRRGSVKELMAIDNLCLTSEEMERC
ncbi:hypothetical protein BGX31_003021 [Mortierella sp. GBA43]|nr:hypothetical protein BGX31_003021 [Mortierella sp. GBA43]